MHTFLKSCALLLYLLPLIASTRPAVAGNQEVNPRLKISTELGDVIVRLYAKKSPATVENFLRYVDSKAFEGASFYRTVTLENQPNNAIKIEVVQAGIQASQQAFPPIALERTSVTGLSHRDGTLSMARTGPDTATGHFFICIGEQPELDFGGLRNPDGQGFAAFGQVISGMATIKAIQESPAEGQSLAPAIKILDVSVLSPAEE